MPRMFVGPTTGTDSAVNSLWAYPRAGRFRTTVLCIGLGRCIARFTIQAADITAVGLWRLTSSLASAVLWLDVVLEALCAAVGGSLLARRGFLGPRARALRSWSVLGREATAAGEDSTALPGCTSVLLGSAVCLPSHTSRHICGTDLMGNEFWGPPSINARGFTLLWCPC